MIIRPQGLPRLSSTTGDDHQSVVGQGPLKRLFEIGDGHGLRIVQGVVSQTKHVSLLFAMRPQTCRQIGERVAPPPARHGKTTGARASKDLAFRQNTSAKRFRRAGCRPWREQKASWKIEISDYQDSRKSARLNDLRFESRAPYNLVAWGRELGVSNMLRLPRGRKLRIVCCGAVTQTFDLQEDEPDPMSSFFFCPPAIPRGLARRRDSGRPEDVEDRKDHSHRFLTSSNPKRVRLI
jgi:hypothetical protein